MSTEPQKLPLPALTTVGWGDRDHVAILDSLPREWRHIIPTQNPCKIPSDRAPALCASLRNDTVVHRFEDGVESTCSREGSVVRVQSGLRQWTKRPSVDSETPSTLNLRWDSSISVGGISPGGARLVTFHGTRHLVHNSVWDARSGQLQAHLPIHQSLPTPPLDIKFESEDRFYSEHDTCRISCAVTLLNSGAPSHSVTRSP